MQPAMGFRPLADWVREMKRCTILATDAPEQETNVYDTERPCWRLLW